MDCSVPFAMPAKMSKGIAPVENVNGRRERMQMGDRAFWESKAGKKYLVEAMCSLPFQRGYHGADDLK
jgi:hypothetical protein